MREVGILIRKLGKMVGSCHKCIDVVICTITLYMTVFLKYVLWFTPAGYEYSIDMRSCTWFPLWEPSLIPCWNLSYSTPGS